ncbi:MAG: hypothetical protein DI622_10085 [Chryseobacterium sp.]|nr:MAG: hypothetical protein DI622_10085 [Chryseobacterium sp.]
MHFFIYQNIFLKHQIIADNKSKKGKSDRNKVSVSENYEIQYFKEKIFLSVYKW